MKLNIGSHSKRIRDYLNMDALDIDGVDIVWDMTVIPYKDANGLIEDNSVEEILSQESLEHLPFRSIQKVVNEWYRILQQGGNIQIQVPDIGRMCEYYVNREVCDCVPHKAATWEDFKSNPECPVCEGRGKINPVRWRFAFSGAQKHRYDAHLTHFTQDMMLDVLVLAGFVDIEFIKNPYKIVVKAKK